MLVHSHKYSCVPHKHNVYTTQGTTMNVCDEGNFRGPFLKYNSYTDLQCILSLHPSQTRRVHEGGSDHLHFECEHNYIQNNTLRHSNRFKLFYCD
jgi:hypothetical protein